MTTERSLSADSAGVSRARWLLSALLIAGAALFAIGVAVERTAADHHVTGETTHVEGSDESAETTPVEAASPESSSEKVFGVNTESALLVAFAVAISIALALLTWRTNVRLVLLAATAFAALFAAVDVAELIHQIRESRTGIAVLAALIALIHIATAAVAERRLMASKT